MILIIAIAYIVGIFITLAILRYKYPEMNIGMHIIAAIWWILIIPILFVISMFIAVQILFYLLAGKNY